MVARSVSLLDTAMVGLTSAIELRRIAGMRGAHVLHFVFGICGERDDIMQNRIVARGRIRQKRWRKMRGR